MQGLLGSCGVVDSDGAIDAGCGGPWPEALIKFMIDRLDKGLVWVLRQEKF